ncbi:MAG: ICC-like protein phosphoesterase [Myxococcaceae bacterium]|nr:ICC-like protein phosphoesterase [Myxococcaceae bacterium]
MTDATIARAGQTFRLMPERAMLWEERAVLCASDLHWGRESLLQQRGMAVPDGSLAEDMARLDRALDRTGATALWVLGDWFHHPDGLDAGTVAAITRWRDRRAALSLVAVLGNHDRGADELLRALGATVHRERHVAAGVGFVHDPADPYAGFAWCGHLHPAVRLPSRVPGPKLPCFWITPTRAHLPAFSALAAGAGFRAGAGDAVFAVTERAVRALR